MADKIDRVHGIMYSLIIFVTFFPQEIDLDGLFFEMPKPLTSHSQKNLLFHLLLMATVRWLSYLHNLSHMFRIYQCHINALGTFDMPSAILLNLTRAVGLFNRI